MVLEVPGHRQLTEEEANQLFFLLLGDDTEDAPWMVMGSPQYAATSDFFQTLREYSRRQRKPWFVAGMTPILYLWPGQGRKHQLAPDVFVALAPDRPRSSYDSTSEGFPSFVLEVVSPSSEDRDRNDKSLAYELLGAREYALFTPDASGPARLEGYRRNSAGRFEPWQPDREGRLWSDVLGLFLLVQGEILRAATPDGRLLLTFDEAIAASTRVQAERDRVQAERDRVQAENEELRREIERLRQNPEADR